MGDTIEFSKLEKARSTLEEIENRIQEIEERQRAIPGLLAVQTARLGEAITGKLNAEKIHAEIERLERENRHLDREALGLAGPYRDAEKALKLAEAEEARERFAALAAEVLPLPGRIFANLDAAHKDLARMIILQRDMADAEHAAGKLAPITDRPEAPILIPQGAAQLLATTYRSLVQTNVEALMAAGYKFED